LVYRHCPRYFLTLDLSYVPPRSVVIAGIAIVPIEQYGNKIGCQVMLAISGADEIVEACLATVLFHEFGLYLSEEASLRVAYLGQASKEGFIVDGVIPCPPTSEPIQCQMLTDSGVLAFLSVTTKNRIKIHPRQWR
jgi:hypothetical protein